ncbi:MAG TPA: DUF3043 domain-containing protein [Mycobacteriales bacterium]|nr:DUF3043 domain-containing protein [Mycobacteriales bacterium]
MNPLRRRVTTPAEPADDLASVEARAGAKGKVTPRRTDARAARAATRKKSVPKGRKEAAARRREILRETKQAMQSTDVSKLPANERVPELVYVRDLVDSRFHPAEAVIWVMVLVFLLGAVPVYGIQLLANLFGLAFLLASLLATWLRSAAIQKTVLVRYPRSAQRVRFYAARRMLSPRRFRRPVPRLKRGARVA